jgi:hypothetical protein
VERDGFIARFWPEYPLIQYANLNLLYSPVDPLMTGMELVWGSREDKNGETNNDTRVQFSMKYKFQL